MFKKSKLSSFDLYVYGILIAFEILMSFTFLGYIHIAPISVAFAYIPVLIAGCFFGPLQSTVMGIIFGLSSIYKSTAFYVLPSDMLFSPFLSGNPVGSLILALGTRTLFGYLTGVAFQAAKRQNNTKVKIGIISLLCPPFQAFLVLAAMKLFFSDSVYVYLKSPYLVISNIISAVVCIFITQFLWEQYNGKSLKNLRNAINASKDIPYIDMKKKHVVVLAFSAFVFVMTIAAAVYFSNRMSYMLGMHDVVVSDEISVDLIQLQIQFMGAMFSLNIISIMVMALGYQYTAYTSFLGELDAVTGVMGRRIFLNCCEKSQKNNDSQSSRSGWFLFLDIDRFKKINDTMGHMVGDRVLKEIASLLKDKFYEYGIVGRMGGDEFAVMIDKKYLSEDELKKMLDDFLSGVSCILEPDFKVSCSIGACWFSFPEEISLLMEKTDNLLYESKQKGRACYTLGAYNM